MILSDKTIEKLLAEGSLAIEPLEPEQIQPASVDIRLGDTFGIVEDTPSGIVGLEDEIAYKTIRTDRYIPVSYTQLLLHVVGLGRRLG